MYPLKSAKQLILITITTLFTAIGSIQAEEIIKQGTWEKKNHSISGTWTLIEKDNNITLELDEAFKTRNAPDLKLFLSPIAIEDLNNNNAIEGSIFIADLKSNKRSQSYTLPEGIDLSKYQSLIIHCEKYTKLWGGSNL